MQFDIKIVGDNELQLFLNRTAKNIKPALISGLDEAGDLLQGKIKEKFGTYQAGWPKLKRASVIAKSRKKTQLKGVKRGSAVSIGIDSPLLLMSNLKNSIQKEIRNAGLEAVIFSDEVYAAVHEYGYKQVPARSYMRLTLWDEEENVIRIIESKIDKLL